MSDLQCEQCDYVAPDDPERFRKSAESRLRAHVARIHPNAPNGSEPTETDAEGTGTDSPDAVADMPAGEEAPVTDTGEVPPGGALPAVAPPRSGRGLVARIRSRGKKEPKAEEVKRPRGRPPGRRARLSAAELFTDIWGFGGNQLQRVGHIPTGRMVTFQAPVAGELIDDVVAGTAVDRIVLQKIIGAKGTLDSLIAIFGPPVITWNLEKALANGADPAVVAQLQAALKGVIRESLPTMLPAVKRVREREARTQAQMVDLLDPSDLDFLGVHIVDGKPVDADGRTVDVADLFVSMLFAEWQPVPVEPTEVPTQ